MLKMIVGENLNPRFSLFLFFCVIYDGLRAALEQSNHSAFPWPCPAFCSSLIQTHSISWSSLISPRAAEAWAGKEESGPASRKPFPFPVSRPQIDSSAAGARPETMRGIFGAVIWRTHGMWTGHTLKRVTHSAGPKKSMGGAGRGGHQGTKIINTTPPLVPPGSDQCSGPAPGAWAIVQPTTGRRPENTHTHSHTSSSGSYGPVSRCEGRAGSVKGDFFSLHVPHTFCQSHTHTRALSWSEWFCHVIKVLHSLAAAATESSPAAGQSAFRRRSSLLLSGSWRNRPQSLSVLKLKWNEEHLIYTSFFCVLVIYWWGLCFAARHLN